MFIESVSRSFRPPQEDHVLTVQLMFTVACEGHRLWFARVGYEASIATTTWPS
jgi:hypothetical protein